MCRLKVFETFATPPLFDQFLRQAQTFILEIRQVLLWSKLSPSLNLNKNGHFSKFSLYQPLFLFCGCFQGAGRGPWEHDLKFCIFLFDDRVNLFAINGLQ